MGIYRMYTGDDNETHIEELPLSEHPELGELQDVGGMQIQQTRAGGSWTGIPLPTGDG